MKKMTATLAAALLCAVCAHAQARYDSLRNFPGKDVQQLIGQVLYLKDNAAARGNNGYGIFAKTADFDLGPYGRNVFRGVKSAIPLETVSDYGRMARHYFKVTNVVTRPEKSFTKAAVSHYLELQDMANGEKCYAVYEVSTPKLFRDFVVMGYFEKMGRLYTGRTFVYTGKEPSGNPAAYAGLQDMKGTGQRKDIEADTEWTCTDVAIQEGGDYQVIAVMENPVYGKVYTLVSDLQDTSDGNAKFKTYDDLRADIGRAQQKEADRIRRNAARLQEATDQFGDAAAQMLVRGEVQKGMTKEMCRWALGDPASVATVTDHNGDKVEQWSYTSGRYLYFRNDKLERESKITPYKDDTKYLHN